jgi:chromosome segregation ATPase
MNGRKYMPDEVKNGGTPQQPEQGRDAPESAAPKLSARLEEVERQLEAERAARQAEIEKRKAANDESAQRRLTINELKQQLDETSEKAAKYDELSSRLQQLEQERDRAAREALVMRVATETGLPPALAGRLQGETEEALREDAQELAELIPQQAPAGSRATPNPGGTPTGYTDDDLRKILRGGATDDLLPGGGVLSREDFL